MKKTFREYKAQARAAMSGNYGMLLAALFIAVFAPNAIIQILSLFLKTSHISVRISLIAVSILVSVIIGAPLKVGMCRVYLKNALGSRADINEELHPFRSNLTNVVKVCLIRDLKLLLWTLIPCVIGWLAYVYIGGMIISRSISADEIYTTLQEVSLYINSGVGSVTDDMLMTLIPVISSLTAVMLLCCIPGIIKSYEYRMIDYILAEDDDISSAEAFKRTKEMMDGQKLRLFGLQMSFIGWMALGFVTCSVAVIFVLPYMQAAEAQFYIDISRQEKDIINYEAD